MGKLDIHLKDWLLNVVRTFFGENELMLSAEETTYVKPYPIQDVTQAINELDESLRIPFSMYLGGCTYEQIATQMNLPLGTVKSRVYFAREEFKNRMQAKEYQHN